MKRKRILRQRRYYSGASIVIPFILYFRCFICWMLLTRRHCSQPPGCSGRQQYGQRALIKYHNLTQLQPAENIRGQRQIEEIEVALSSRNELVKSGLLLKGCQDYIIFRRLMSKYVVHNIPLETMKIFEAAIRSGSAMLFNVNEPELIRTRIIMISRGSWRQGSRS